MMHAKVVKKYEELRAAKAVVSKIEHELGELVGNELSASTDEPSGKLVVTGPAPRIADVLDSPGASGDTVSKRYAAAREAIAEEAGPKARLLPTARGEAPGARGEVVGSLPHRIVELVNGSPGRVFSKKDLFEMLSPEFPDRIERSFGTLAYREARKGHIGKKGPGVFVAKKPARGVAKASAEKKATAAPRTVRRVKKGEARA